MPTLSRLRERSRDDRFGTTHGFYYNNGADFSSGSNAKVYGSYKWMRDIVTPSFFDQQKKGSVIMSPMSSIVTSRVGGCNNPSDIMRTRTLPSGTLAWWTGDLAMFQTASSVDWWVGERPSLFQSSDYSQLTTEVCTRTLSSIGRSNTDMWENLAEAGKTYSMLESPLASWFKFEKKARIATSALSAANAWLAYRYGVRPLVQSVDAVLGNLKRKLKPLRITTREQGKISLSASDSFQTGPGYWGTCSFAIDRQRKQTLEVRAMSIDEVISTVAYDLGLTSKSIMTLPWELVPWSFVVDWAVNVGDFLGALAQSFQPSSLGQCYTQIETLAENRQCNSMTAINPGTTEVVTNPSAWMRTDTAFKSRVAGLPVPGLVVKSDFRLSSLTRVSDATALVAQQISRAFLNRR